MKIINDFRWWTGGKHLSSPRRCPFLSLLQRPSWGDAVTDFDGHDDDDGGDNAHHDDDRDRDHDHDSDEQVLQRDGPSYPAPWRHSDNPLVQGEHLHNHRRINHNYRHRYNQRHINHNHRHRINLHHHYSWGIMGDIIHILKYKHRGLIGRISERDLLPFLLRWNKKL